MSAANKTAPAARSFIFPASSLYSGETKSTRNSMAVFSISVIITTAIAKTINTHSVLEIPKNNPAAITENAATK